MSFSDYLEDALLDHVLGGSDYIPPSNLYIALFTDAPSDSGGGTEVTGGSYARVTVSNNTTNWPSATGNTKSNGSTISFPTATGDWGTVTHVGIFDASSGGNLLAWAALDSAATVNNGDDFQFAPGALQITLAGSASNYLRAALLDFVFGDTEYVRPTTVYLAAFTSPPNAGGGGTEVTSGSYQRVQISNNSGIFPSASSGQKSNASQFDFPTATANWGTVTDLALFDSNSGGNLLFFGSLSTSRSVGNTNTLRIRASQLTVSLN